MTERSLYLTNGFKRDAKKHYLSLVSKEWAEVFNCLLFDKPIPEKYQDHALVGNFRGFRDCHIKPDLVLIYKVVDDVVELHQLGMHSEIFG